MIVITLEPETIEYLKFVLEKHCQGGLPLVELQVAARTWTCVEEAKEVSKSGMRRYFSDEDFASLQPPPKSEEPEVQHIQGPLSVKLNGDMALPISKEQAELLRGDELER